MNKSELIEKLGQIQMYCNILASEKTSNNNLYYTDLIKDIANTVEEEIRRMPDGKV